MRKSCFVAYLAVMILVALLCRTHAEYPDPPGPPGSDAARMKTLNEIEPRNIIKGLPYFITNSGSYYLGSSLRGVGGSNGIVIAASDVEIDLGGFSMTGGSNSWHGIVAIAPLDNIKVKNGVLRNWHRHGINLTNVKSTVISHVNVMWSGWGGIYASKNALIEQCTIAAGGWNSPPPGPPPQDDAIQAGVFSTINDCKIQSNGGAGINAAEHTRISRCSITENRNAEGIFAGNYCIIQGCVCAKNGHHGILVADNCRVVGNTCGDNGTNVLGGAGIMIMGKNNLVEGNTFMKNDIGIVSPPNTTGNLIIRNSSSGNRDMNYDVQGTNNVGEIINTTGNTVTNSNPWANFAF